MSEENQTERILNALIRVQSEDNGYSSHIRLTSKLIKQRNFDEDSERGLSRKSQFNESYKHATKSHDNSNQPLRISKSYRHDERNVLRTASTSDHGIETVEPKLKNNAEKKWKNKFRMAFKKKTDKDKKTYGEANTRSKVENDPKVNDTELENILRKSIQRQRSMRDSRKNSLPSSGDGTNLRNSRKHAKDDAEHNSKTETNQCLHEVSNILRQDLSRELGRLPSYSGNSYALRPSVQQASDNIQSPDLSPLEPLHVMDQSAFIAHANYPPLHYYAMDEIDGTNPPNTRVESMLIDDNAGETDTELEDLIEDISTTIDRATRNNPQFNRRKDVIQKDLAKIIRRVIYDNNVNAFKNMMTPLLGSDSEFQGLLITMEVMSRAPSIGSEIFQWAVANFRVSTQNITRYLIEEDTEMESQQQ